MYIKMGKIPRVPECSSLHEIEANINFMVQLEEDSLVLHSQIAIKYLTNLVLNKRTLTINKNLYSHPQSQTDIKPHPIPRGFLSMVGPTCSNSHRMDRHWHFLHIFSKQMLKRLNTIRQEPTYHKVGNEPHHGRRGLLRKGRPTCSNSRQIDRCCLFF